MSPATSSHYASLSSTAQSALYHPQYRPAVGQGPIDHVGSAPPGEKVRASHDVVQSGIAHDTDRPMSCRAEDRSDQVPAGTKRRVRSKTGPTPTRMKKSRRGKVAIARNKSWRFLRISKIIQSPDGHLEYIIDWESTRVRINDFDSDEALRAAKDAVVGTLGKQAWDDEVRRMSE
ncbi:hypothetical protein MRS44_003925 [Fusarium solani]|uniref:uncharacterized protein n=1 Tax=Fusarium solani TaxID=169388 RepID=UPI0032C48F9A|nr:hypothetical protein MRS44_003925 [Fusarium solani]